MTEEDTTIELHDTSNWLWISTELPDCSLDDVHISTSGGSVRIQAKPSDTSAGIDRTITLTERVNPADVVVASDDSVLTVIVPNEN